ncbi:MAG: hypothetical protein HY466_00690 [Deltaproteobacteria bacterium]|nr:hypothetical protein [Deltaproteobacteria bacterium]
MIVELIVVGAAALTAWGCSDSGEEEPAGKPELPPKKPDPDGGGKLSLPERSKYQEPDHFTLPQATSEGLIYHPYFSRDGKPTADLADPVALECLPEENLCYFAAGHEYFSFPSDEKTLSAEGAVPLTLVADFADEDGTTRHLVDVLRQGSLIYALYDGESAGIAIRSAQGEKPEPSDGGTSESALFSFNEQFSTPVTCPTDLMAFENKFWVSAANCAGGVYGDGVIAVIDIDKDGRLSPSDSAPLVTTQKRPNQMAVWDAGKGRRLIVSVNPGEEGNSGLDFFDPERPAEGEPVNNLLLTGAAAGRIAITDDQLVGFVGDTARHLIFVNDMAWTADYLNVTVVPEGADGGVEALPINDAPLAGADNPVRLFPPGSPFENGAILSLAHDGSRQKILASTSNGKIFQLRVPYTLVPGGVAILPGFGFIEGHYFCNDLLTEGCGPAAFLEHGAIALTQNPAGVTYLPDALLMD